MPAISFSVFKDLIESGQKTQTIRVVRKRPIKTGDRLFLYWKQRTQECQKLGETICKSVSPITITSQGISILYSKLPEKEVEELAIADGFASWKELREFFDKTHGLPFCGVLIKWEAQNNG